MDPSRQTFLGRGRGKRPPGESADRPGSQGGGRGRGLWPSHGGGDMFGRTDTRGGGPGTGRGRGEKGGAWGQDATDRRKSGGRGKKKKRFEQGKQGESDVQLDYDAAVQKMAAAQKQMQESAQRHLEQYEDSSSEEEELDKEKILSSAVQSYNQALGSEEDADLSHVKQHLVQTCHSGAAVCLICIATIKRNEPVWNCRLCVCMLHLQCIQRWVRDGVTQTSLLSDEHFPNRDIPWQCPKCRHDYSQAESPTRYFCFCGKVEDPEFDPWLVPHSCGQTCSRALQPECGHNCLLLCHPGPCPPCPQMVKSACYCRKKPPEPRRCAAREWSCSQVCGRRLPCGLHTCGQACHAGDCPPCRKESSQPCQCGQQSAVRPCAEPTWQCDKVCGKALSCGFHTCEKVCHSATCGPCPRTGERTCPCGKTVYSDLSCTEDAPTCMDTCGKELACGSHMCMDKCHFGPCGQCWERATKTCRCGQRKKSLPCNKEYLCETRCTNMRTCQRHQCRRKCCDGQCPACDQNCGRTLNCRNHKCPTKCHPGQCYPCNETVNISCPCGATVITLPCGRKKGARPPKCMQPCRRPPDCHHPQRVPHPCHANDCPPCRQRCCLPLTGCSHICPHPCHTAVKVLQKPQGKRAGPWEPEPQPVLTVVKFDCPPCQVPLPVQCVGGHEISPLPCSQARPFPCGRPCGRRLTCTNHTCQKICHLVTIAGNDPSLAGPECEACEEGCGRPRPEGCTHTCLRSCHPGDCPPCTQMVRQPCHCKIIQLFIECSKWTGADNKTRRVLLSCQSPCPKLLSCGHQCSQVCHAGNCPGPGSCNRKTNIRCPCRRKKKDVRCSALQKGEVTLECDEICQQVKEEKQKAAEQEKEKHKEAEKQKQQEELEEFQRKMNKRRRQRKQREEVDEKIPWFKDKKVLAILISTVTALVFAIMYQVAFD
ncbi:NF-X1-type zinc finger protein NFXL1-like [Branchiostoma lanceolatum]|uniref:NF-X1-type zinc finger protein NFXL1-like n=1 Tax=Branchiostoma lanceolatum TaxID=7740 RepID=UPI003451D7B2